MHSTRTSIRQRLGITDGFQSWSFMWQDGMEQAPATERRIYVMPFSFATSLRITAGLRSEIGMAFNAVAREVVEVANTRHWAVGSGNAAPSLGRFLQRKLSYWYLCRWSRSYAGR